MKRVVAIRIVILFWFLVHLFLLLFYGYRKLYDAQGYLAGADYFLANRALQDPHFFFYLTHIFSITFFRWLFPNMLWPAIFFQCVISGVALLLLYQASIKLFENYVAAFLSSIIFLFWWDNIQWNTVLMTESLACSLTCVLIYRLSCFAGRPYDFILIFVLLILIFFTRPTGIIPIAGVVFFLLAHYWKSASKVKGLNVAMIAGILVLGILAADQMFLRWDFTEQYIQGNIVTYMDTTEGTELYEPSLRLDAGNLVIPSADDRPIIKMITFICNNPVHFFKVGFLKLWYLVSDTRPYYSKSHNFFSLTWLSIVYTFFFFGWKQLKDKPMRVFVLFLIIGNCALVSISTVDWDNRFYIPMEPAIVLVAGSGAARLLEKFSRTAYLQLDNK